MNYTVTSTDSGKWLIAVGSVQLFTFIKNEWPHAIKVNVTQKYEAALAISAEITESVKKKDEKDIAGGLFILDQLAMTKAMNSIDGMGMTSAANKKMNGTGTAGGVTKDFFNTILGALDGNVTPILEHLQKQLGQIQTLKKQNTSKSTFGIVVGLISLMPTLDIPITTFQYVYLDKSQSSEFEKFHCLSSRSYSYKIDYTVDYYNYSSPS